MHFQRGKKQIAKRKIEMAHFPTWNYFKLDGKFENNKNNNVVYFSVKLSCVVPDYLTISNRPFKDFQGEWPYISV